MGSAASVENEGGVTMDKCKLILGPNFDAARFNSLADANGCITKKQLEDEINTFESSARPKEEAAPAPLSKKEQWRSARNMNLIIAQDDRELCKEMFGSLYSDALFDSIADENGCISKEQMMVELAKLKASAQGGGEEALSSTTAAALFSSKLQTGIAVSCEQKQLQGLCGRLIHATDPADLLQLRGHSRSSCPLVVGHKGLHALLQCSDGAAMLLKLGWTAVEIKAMAAEEGRVFKLVIFPDDAVTPEPALANWDNIIALAAAQFPAVGGRLQSHLEALKSTAFDAIDPDNKIDGSEYLSVESYEAAEDTLFNTRLFLRSQFDLRSSFKGTGLAPDGNEEYVVQNVAVSAITDAQIVDVAVAASA